MSGSGEIRPHMEVVGADGEHVGTVDGMERGAIKLTRRDDPDGSGQHHHLVPLSAIRMVEGSRVWLTLPAQQARAMVVGGMSPEAMEEGSAPSDEGIARPDRTGISPMEGGASGNIHGGGSRAPSGGGAGGTASHSMGSGGGIAHDPNMDPSGRGDPDL
ncbi:DUF2171 domain-containing protein [Belnapia rosea]|uniref:DUF2171 domain-containing protein n=1 Tax=Belnapia rosea TaxID=938405 RepID=UPI000885A94F|nr:DUF2171 domain-containing protein [Belnapia rosea]SDB65643.1 hypothetical protein SAMN02927895_02812 [Belnapia rosea]